MLDARPDEPRAVAPGVLLRPGVLDGLGIVVAGAGGSFPGFAAAIADGCAQLGASVASLLAETDEEGTAAAALSLAAPADASVLVCDAAGLLARELAGGSPPLSGRESLAEAGGALAAALACTWNAVRAIVLPAMLERERPGRVIAVAPPADGRPVADAARAALENLARTLSVEWARHGVTTVSIAPGGGTTPDEMAALVAYLASPAGAYYSGCELDQRGVSAAAALDGRLR